MMLLFSLLSYIPSAVYEEKEMGTVPFTLRFFKLSLVINILFVLISVAAGMVVPSFLGTPCMGLWPILFCDLVI